MAGKIGAPYGNKNASGGTRSRGGPIKMQAPSIARRSGYFRMVRAINRSRRMSRYG